MKMPSTDRDLPETTEPAKLDWEIVALAQRRARRLRAEAFTRAIYASWRAIRTLIARARAPIEFAPVGTCP
jgi:hypothetical protein